MRASVTRMLGPRGNFSIMQVIYLNCARIGLAVA